MNPASTQSLPERFDRKRSLIRDERLPRLSEVLDGISQRPWDLAAFETFLEANFCGEILQFTTEVASYRWYFEIKKRCNTTQTDNDSQSTLSIIFEKIMQTFIVQNAPQEINIPGEVRNSLLALQSSAQPPNPSEFDVACNMMYDLMAGIFVQFLKRRPSSDRFSLPESHIPRDNTISKDSNHEVKEVSLPLSGFFPVYERRQSLWNPARVYRNIKRRYPRSKRSKSVASDSSSVQS